MSHGGRQSNQRFHSHQCQMPNPGCLPESKPSRHAPPTPTQLIPASQNSTPLPYRGNPGSLRDRGSLASPSPFALSLCPDLTQLCLDQILHHRRQNTQSSSDIGPCRNLVCDQTGFVLLLLRLSSRLPSLICLLSPASIGTSARRSFRPGLGTFLTHAAKRAQSLPFPPNLLGVQFFVGSKAIADPSPPRIRITSQIAEHQGQSRTFRCIAQILARDTPDEKGTSPVTPTLPSSPLSRIPPGAPLPQKPAHCLSRDSSPATPNPTTPFLRLESPSRTAVTPPAFHLLLTYTHLYLPSSHHIPEASPKALCPVATPHLTTRSTRSSPRDLS